MKDFKYLARLIASSDRRLISLNIDLNDVPGNARLVVAKYNLSLKASRSLVLFTSSMRSSVWEDM